MNDAARMVGCSTEFGCNESACDTINRIIFIGQGAKSEAINHEFGHLIEKYMMNAEDVNNYKKTLTAGLGYENIEPKIYHDSVGNDVSILVIDSDIFESEYQSRLYVDVPMNALNSDGTINIDLMQEVISEPFRKYMKCEEIGEDVKKLIEGAIL